MIQPNNNQPGRASGATIRRYQRWRSHMANNNQPGASGATPDSFRAWLKRMDDVAIKHLPLIAAVSLILSFMITWSASAVASSHIDHMVNAFAIFRNISGTYVGIIPLAIILLVIAYSAWMGYNVIAELYLSGATSKWQPKAADWICVNVLAVIATIILAVIATIITVTHLFFAEHFLISYIVDVIVAILVIVLWGRQKPFTKITNRITERRGWFALTSVILTILEGILIISIFSGTEVAGFWNWMLRLLLFFLTSLFLSFVNVSLVRSYLIKENLRTKTYREMDKPIRNVTSSFLGSIVTYWLSQMTSLLVIIGTLMQDQSVSEDYSFFIGVAVIFVILCIPLAGMLVGAMGGTDSVAGWILIAIIAACLMLIIPEVPQQLFLNQIGYRSPRPFTLWMRGHAKPIVCKNSNYQIPYDGKVYFSCVENPKKKYYGVYVASYPKKQIEKGVVSIQPKVYCIKNVSDNHLDCIEKWFPPPQKGFPFSVPSTYGGH